VGLTRTAVIVGTGATARRIYSSLVRSPRLGIEPIAFVDTGAEEPETVIFESSYRRTRQARVLLDPITPRLLRRLGATVVILADADMDARQRDTIRREVEQAGAITYVLPQPFAEGESSTEYVELDGVVLAYRAKSTERPRFEAAKRVLDIVLTVLSLVLLSPVILAAALAVKRTSPGPVIFRQKRVGRGGQHFEMFKFRTMHVQSARYACSPISGDDPRITQVGRFLRHTCIDEIPQLINVLRGEMSLVGPRPEMPFIVERYEATHLKRLAVKPGITGLWQLSGDRRAPIHENISYDLYYLEARGMQVTEADSIKTAQETLSATTPDAAIVDVSLPDGNGLELLEHFKQQGLNVPVIVLTGQGSIQLAVRAIKEGAEQFLTKPVELPVLHTLLLRAGDTRRLRQQSVVSQSKARRDQLNPFLGRSAAIRRLQQLAQRVVHSESPILIQGETGSGKGVLAKWIHDNSPRADEVFMDLNCAGLEREFLETELFGHERGAFTGAVHAKPGLLEVADRGTVFLDEIGDIDLTVQPKLLKVLETKRFRRLGDVHDRTVDIRLISATHRDLKELVRQHRFRDDLYFRITIIPLRIPPLRERQEDIPILAADILRRIATERGSDPISLDAAALSVLQEYAWPGNIREMRNVLERAAQISPHAVLSPHDLELQYARHDVPSLHGHVADATSKHDLTLHEVETRYIEEVLAQEDGSIERAARRLGISRSSLYGKVKNKEVERCRAEADGGLPSIVQ
jgi:DNA-binding NtrC family response regulator